MNKKGALELSMNTIIIIVIGVVLLSLGLMFVRGIFGNVEDLANNAFEDAENAINQIATHDQKLTVPSQLSVKQGDSTVSHIWVVNEDPVQQIFTISVSASNENDAGPKIRISIPSNQATLDTGEEVGFAVGVEVANNLDKGLYGYQININGGAYASNSFFVKVE
ncbi:hypothetical protein J4425_01710 [Candidatus Woesearchaeota archaeon]|nr:hypothetical protein [Candidatus Woesearchaeota archaeon]